MIKLLRAIRAIAASTVFLAVFQVSPIYAQMPPGPIRLAVDTTHAPQKIIHAHLQMPVQPGPLVLRYPEWIPGEHMPDGPIVNVAGLKFVANGKMLPWRRDLLDMFEFHLEVPPGTTSLDIDLDFLLSEDTSGYTADASATAFLNLVSWNQVVLSPAGYAAKDLTFVPSLRLPAGWKFGTALPGAKQNGDIVEFAPVPLATLVDSPVIEGRYFRVIDLAPGQTPPHEMDIAADSEAALAMPPETEKAFRKLVAETGALFGIRHYRDYHFLLSLSDNVAHFGLEHHESSDDRSDERSLTDDAARVYFADLLPHEFVHSWNGKFRRPADLLSPDYHQPMKDDLLWVYEGLTEYLGEVLTARSGLWNQAESRDAFAARADMMNATSGREWRSLQDTADSAVFLYDADLDWSNWRRSTDFYEESVFLWLDVDANLRRLTDDKKSMNDFCRAFFGGPGGEPALEPYAFDDIVAALNALAPYDWAGFLRTRLDSFDPGTVNEALQNSGWKTVYSDGPNKFDESHDAVRKRLTLRSSVGLILSEDGTVADVIYDGPAYKAGIGPGMKITAINGKQYSADEMKDAVKAAESASDPIRLVASNGQEVETYSVDYHGGLRYPHLERDTSHADTLSEVLHPLAQ